MWWNKYLSVQFEEKGRKANADCWGLVQMIYKDELGIDLPGYEELYQTTNDRDVLSVLIENERKSKWIEPETPKEFDVIILKMRGLPMHVGIVTKTNYMLHCCKGINTVHVPFNTMQWKDKVMGFARWET